LRSGLDGFSRIRFAGAGGEDVQAAPIRNFAEAIGGADRYEALALEALYPCVKDLSATERERTAILLGLPHPKRPGVPHDLARMLCNRLARRLHMPIQSIYPISLGRVSTFWSLTQADGLLRARRFESCIVGGVDVLVNGASVRGLCQAGMVKEEWDGFIPGEAAAFIRLVPQPSQGIWGNAAPRISGAGVASEPADGSAGSPLVGVGVGAAFRSAARDANIVDSAVRLLINDVNGARVTFEDNAMGRIRFFRSRDTNVQVWHVASYVGETGAAAGGIQLIWALAALELGFAPGPCVMLSSADADQRTAVVIQGSDAPAGVSLAVGTGEPVLHVTAATQDDREARDPGIRLLGENLHGDLLWRNFQELSWLWSLREDHHSKSGDAWTDIESFESRLVAHLDAIAWSGVAAQKFAARHLLSEDLDEAAGAAMVLLSFAPERSLLHAVRDAMIESEDRARAIAAVLPHVPAQTADPLLNWMLRSNRPQLIGGALRALSTAGRVSSDRLVPLFDSRVPSVVVDLVHAAGAGGLTQFWPPLQALTEAVAEIRLVGVNRLAYLSIAPQGSAAGRVDEQLAQEMPLACALLCSRDGISFAELTAGARGMSAALIEAHGWYGDQNAAGLLLAILDAGKDSHKAAAASALYRIYGIACHEEIETEPTQDEGEMHGRRTTQRLSQKRSAWESALEEFARSTPRARRLRHGLPWSRKSALEHLKRPELSFSERLVAAWEYAVVNRAPLPCYPSLFVRRQQRLLAEMT
jgi:3-oxoacyl-[acyl-carrier-protein] synthase-1